MGQAIRRALGTLVSLIALCLVQTATAQPPAEEGQEQVPEVPEEVDTGPAVEARLRQLEERDLAREEALGAALTRVEQLERAATEAAAREAAEPVEEEAEPEAEPDFQLVLGGITFTPSLQVRPRLEFRVDPVTPGGTGRDSFLITNRARLGMGAQFQSLSMLLQIQDARSFGNASPGRDAGTTLHQGWLQIGEDGSYLRVGRQEINYGGQRMLGALNWASGARSFDAIRGHIKLGDTFELDASASMVNAPNDFVDAMGVAGHSDGDYLVTFQALWRAHEAFVLDLYVLYRHDDPNASLRDRRRNITSPGVRITGTPATGLTYDIEGVVQVGGARNGPYDPTATDNARQHLAFGVAGELAYAIDADVHPAIAVGGAYGSGQSPDGSVDELDNFFPTNHKFYGFIDYMSWRNMTQGYLRVTLAPEGSNVNFALWFHTFALAEATGRWSNVGPLTLGAADPAGGDTSLGQELDFTVRWRPMAHLSIVGGYSVFIPNGGAERMGHPDAAHWGWLMVDVNLAP